MLERVFNPDNAVWNFLGKIFDLFVLTIIWALCSLPVITIGASTTALYYVVLKLADHREGYMFREFMKSFRQNFLQATRIWLIFLCVGGLLAYSAWWYYNIGTQIGAMILPVIIILIGIYLIILTYLFPLLSRCQVTDKQLFSMAFVMGIKNFGWSLFMIVITGCIMALGIFVLAPLLVFSVGLSAYIHSKVFKEIFKQYQLNLD